MTDALASLSARWNLLEHSFYQRWAKGELTLDELRDYSCQYAQVVAALPRWLEAAAASDAANRATLLAHADEETAHIRLWHEFALSLGVTGADLAAAPANPATAALLAEGDRLAAEGRGAAVAWAFESQSPEVSVAKLDGLRRHYGIDGAGGGRYFALHSGRDQEHRAELASLIAGSDGSAQAAGSMLNRMWDLLSSVEQVAAA